MNRDLLKGAIVSRGLNQADLAEKIGMSSNSLSRKMLGKRVFTLEEVVKICDILDITDPTAIFFNDIDSNMQRKE